MSAEGDPGTRHDPLPPTFSHSIQRIQQYTTHPYNVGTYLTALDLAVTETPVNERGLAFSSSLANVIVLRGENKTGSPRFDVEYDGVLDRASRALAQECLTQHPELKAAQDIVEMGLNTPMRNHVQVILVMAQPPIA